MPLDVWLPVGFELPGGALSRLALFAGADWQILETQNGGRALLARDNLAKHWVDTGLIDADLCARFSFGSEQFSSITCTPEQVLCPVSAGSSPSTKSEALAFALALKATRSIDSASALQDSLYVEKITRLLPTYSISSRAADDVVLGYWLTGGANVSAKAFRRLSESLSWLGASNLRDVIDAAGLQAPAVCDFPAHRQSTRVEVPPALETVDSEQGIPDNFELAGRPALTAFFNEHVIEILKHSERYKALGIDFPSAIVLHGPPGCGKTFAVERLVDFLQWPSFQIDASSVASPYIHETSKRIADVFDKAMKSSPSVLVIDEMEAFLADREVGSGHHRVEEIAEFLRRIPEASKNRVLIISMTNRVEMIDPAILRRGRFDHIISVDYANEQEILSLLDKLLLALPTEQNIELTSFARELAGRPLSDVAFVVREGARLAARAGKNKLDQESLMSAMRSAPAREREGKEKRRIGFV